MNTMTEHIREAVRAELGRRNINRTALAKQAGVSKQFVSQMLNGTAANIPDSWQKVLDALGWELRVFDKDGNEVR
jgi:transcriptional regulator with XRE-family HTH domain